MSDLGSLSARFALLPALGLAVGVAQAEPQFTEDDLFGDIPTVSAASRFEQRLDKAPASVTVITRDLIEMSGAQTFVDIFRLVPGFQAYYVGGNRYGISYHGIGREFPNQIEVMVDGRSVYETLFSSVNWGTLGIGLADIDYIEVVRGSNAPAQGSNAFMGSINIVTRKPVQDAGSSVTLTGGDLQTRRVALATCDSIGDIAYRLSAGYDRNEGFPAVAKGEMDDGRELSQGNLQTTYTPTMADTVQMSLGYAHDRLGWGDSDHPDEFDLANTYGSHQSVNWSHTQNSDHEFQLQAYHSRFKATNINSAGPLYGVLGIDDATAAMLTAITPAPPQVVKLFSQFSGLSNANAAAVLAELNTEVFSGFGELSSERYDVQFQHNFTVTERLRGTWGTGVRYDGLEALHPQSYGADIDEVNYRLFSHQEWQQTDRLTWNLGAMVEDSGVGLLFSPRLSANYQLNPQHAFRTAYARGNRSPSLYERNENSVAKVNDLVLEIIRYADPDLREEMIDTFELAYMYQHRPDVAMDVRLFHEEVREVIDGRVEAAPLAVQEFGDGSVRITSNGDYWQLDGGEIQLSYQVTPSTLARLHYTSVDFDTDIRPSVSPNYPLVSKDDRMARHSAGLLLNHSFSEQWSASVTTYYQSELRWEDGDDFDAITRVDAQLRYCFTLGATEGDIRLIAQNIGEDYSEFNDNNLFQTRYYLTVQLELPE